MTPASPSLGVLGCGKMGAALLTGLVQKQILSALNVQVYDIVPAARESLATRLSVKTAKDEEELAQNNEVILLAVKPPDILPFLKENAETLKGKLVISIAAGVTLQAMTSAAPDTRVIRVMPNTPALVGEGMSAFSPSALATSEDRSLATTWLGAVGRVVEVPEKWMDAITGISGSGPAYVFTIIEALADGACKQGIPKPMALELAAQTLLGASKMVIETGMHPAVLRDQVTSPGGTTIAGLAALEKKGLRYALISAVEEATRRSEELGA